MKLYMDKGNLNFFEALASDTRLSIIQLLCDQDMSIKELAEAIGISSSIMTKHIRKLESAKIVTTSLVKKDGSSHKMCTILNTYYELTVPFRANRADLLKKCYTVSVPVGQYTDIKVTPPCGMVSEEAILGDLDEPNQLMDPLRMQAQLLWFGSGYVEYKLPNYLIYQQTPTDIEISGEFGSEAAGFKDDWPSNIRISLNGHPLCVFTTPGDFGEQRGALTPQWWDNNQYGIYIVVRINFSGVYINGEKKSSITLNDLDYHCDMWTLRFETLPMKRDGGGLTLYGEKFGNSPQDILFKLFYQ